MLTLLLTKSASANVAIGYPWVFLRDIQMTSELEMAAPGSLVRICDHKAKPLGIGYLNPQTALACRVLTQHANTVIDAAWFEQQLGAALKKREALFSVPYYRLAHSEGDGLPGLVVDRFGDTLVCQTSTAGMEALKPFWLAALQTLLRPRTIVFRNDLPQRKKEGLALEVAVEGAPLSGLTEVREGDVRYLADLAYGQKTGWFYDQRANRQHVAALVKGKTVLDLYTHTGGFGIAGAAAGAARVTLADASAHALDIAKQAAVLNGVAKRCEWMEEDIFAVLPRWGKEAKRFDIIIADPPAFIKERRQIGQGLKGYEKLAKLCAGLVTPDGILFIASCSHHASLGAFKNAVEKGIRAAGREPALLRTAGADKDHPAHPQLPENAYLKALTYRL